MVLGFVCARICKYTCMSAPVFKIMGGKGPAVPTDSSPCLPAFELFQVGHPVGQRIPEHHPGSPPGSQQGWRLKIRELTGSWLCQPIAGGLGWGWGAGWKEAWAPVGLFGLLRKPVSCEAMPRSLKEVSKSILGMDPLRQLLRRADWPPQPRAATARRRTMGTVRPSGFCAICTHAAHRNLSYSAFEMHTAEFCCWLWHLLLVSESRFN